MDLSQSARSQDLAARLLDFMAEHIYPNEQRYYAEAAKLGPWSVYPVVDEFKPLARRAGLWNLFLPDGARAACRISTTRRFAKSWDAPTWRRKSSTAARPTPAIWRYSSIRQTSRSAGSIRCWRARFDRPSR